MYKQEAQGLYSVGCNYHYMEIEGKSSRKLLNYHVLPVGWEREGRFGTFNLEESKY